MGTFSSLVGMFERSVGEKAAVMDVFMKTRLK